MNHMPFSFEIEPPNYIPSHYDNHIQRKLSDMKGQYMNQEDYQAKLSEEDVLIYQVYELKRPEVAGELLHGISIIHPGQVGDEFFMTKGHYHTILETSEIYYILKGIGYMVMETLEGDYAVEELSANKVLYVPPRWAHRSINVSKDDDLVMFFAYPGHSGHDYRTIERMGFRKLVVKQNGEVNIINNPRW